MNVVGRTALIAGLSLLTVGCGRRGALLYPDMLVPAAPAALNARQSGSSVQLQFVLPSKDRIGRPIAGVAGVKISKRTIDAAQKDVCRSCMTDYQLFRTIYLDLLPTDTQRFGGELILRDSDVAAGYNYSYRVVPFTIDGVDGAASAATDVLVTLPVSAPAVKIVPFPTEVRLQLLSQHLGGGQLLGYNVYRWPTAGHLSYQPLNKEPLKGNEYVDSTLERGVRYRYIVRALMDLEAGRVAESAASQEVEGMLRDDEE
jgi:hypothetical protein